MEYHIDAKNKILGRVATEIALILQGNKSAAYQRNQVSNDKVYVKNAGLVAVTGKKRTDNLLQAHGLCRPPEGIEH